MVIEYRITFESDGVRISQSVEPDAQGGDPGPGISPGGDPGPGISPGGDPGLGIPPGGDPGLGIPPGGDPGQGIPPGGGTGGGGRVVILGAMVIEGSNGIATANFSGASPSKPRVHTSAPRPVSSLGAALPFHIEKQLASELCWAAVSVSVDNYFGGQSAQTQCSLAQAVLGATGCCGQDGKITKPVPPSCNQRNGLQAGLEAVKRLGSGPIHDQLTFDQIRQQIDGKLPVCVRIGWEGGSPVNGHFVVLGGYGWSPSGDPQVSVLDPFFRSGPWPYNKLVNAGYQRRNGQWTDTYLLRP